jgi:hypothetical protein
MFNFRAGSGGRSANTLAAQEAKPSSVARFMLASQRANFHQFTLQTVQDRATASSLTSTGCLVLPYGCQVSEAFLE